MQELEVGNALGEEYWPAAYEGEWNRAEEMRCAIQSEGLLVQKKEGKTNKQKIRCTPATPSRPISSYIYITKGWMTGRGIYI